jgi:hypothetical protein
MEEKGPPQHADAGRIEFGFEHAKAEEQDAKSAAIQEPEKHSSLISILNAVKVLFAKYSEVGSWCPHIVDATCTALTALYREVHARHGTDREVLKFTI